MRIQLDLPAERVEDLKSLMARAEMETYKELFDNAFTLFEWAIDEVESGKLLASVDEESEKYSEVIMPVLRRVRKKSKRSAEAVLAD